ncbi:MAG TPA: lysylphosphatidylglycerol synthase transmembrane domain-containing protein [Rectinemataceae bacterium]
MVSEPGAPGKEGSGKKKFGKSLFFALLAGLAINAFLGIIVDFGELKAAFSKASILTLLFPFAAILLVYFIDSFRYRYVFYKYKIRISFRDALYNNILGFFFAALTPSSAGGQPFQVIHFSRLGIDSAVASNVVFSRLIEGNFVQLIIAALFFHKGIGMMSGLGKGSYLLIAGMLATVAITVVLTLSLLNPHLLGVLALKLENSRVGRLIAKLVKDPSWAEKLSVWSQSLGEGFKVLWKHNTQTIVIDILATGLTQTIWALSLYVPITRLTGAAPPFQEFLLSYCLCGLVALFIPTPGGSGGVEASYVLVLSALTGKPAATMSAILLWRFGTYYLQLLLGVAVYMAVKVPRDVYAKDSAGLARRIRARPVRA